jgi:hypothetical protein
MPVELTTNQVALLRLERRLKEAGATGLNRELRAALRLAAEPIAEAVRAAALAIPASGDKSTGLRQGLADAVKITVKGGRTAPGVRVSVRHSLAKASQSSGWRHPVYGNRKVWVSEVLDPGWFVRAWRGKRPQAIAKIHAAVDLTARQIVRG